jgi:hypothetical protein
MLPLVVLLLAAPSPEPPRTLRVEYVHSGTADGEHFALSRLALEGPWSGSPQFPVDPLGLGKYVHEVRDAKTGAVLFSRGFASVFGEWKTTAEAKQRPRAFVESARFPLPAAPVRLAIRERGEGGALRELWSVELDPADPAIDRALPAGRAWAVVENGPPSAKVDLLLLGDGYTAAEMDKWHADARRLAGILFATPPFREHRADFNVWAVDTPSDESGVSRPSDGVFRRSALRAAYDAFGSERYVLALDEPRLREAAAAAPYDFVEIVVNERKYGGGGIHNLYATAAADNAFTPYLFLHEFAHHFGGLADEYYTSASAYAPAEGRPEPWEPNVTADSHAAKWASLVAAGTPLPTPWPKERFEALQREIQARRRRIRAERRPEAEMEALFREEREVMSKLLAEGPHAGAVGAFEGAMYEASGYYRPRADCIMFTRDEVGFCPVCARALERVIDVYAGRAPR